MAKNKNIANAASSLGPVALAIVSLAVVVGVGGIVLTQMQPVSYIDSSLQEEAHQPSTPFPTNVTVDAASKSGFQGVIETSEKLVLYDSSASTNTTLTEDTDYIAHYEDGNFSLQNTTTTEDFDSTSDKIFVDYKYEKEGTSTSILSTGVNSLQTFADFFTVIVVISVAAVLFLLLRVVRASGRTVGA